MDLSGMQKTKVGTFVSNDDIAKNTYDLKVKVAD